MMKKVLICAVALVFSIVCLCGCAKTCANCDKEIEKDKEIQIGEEYYGAECVEYCAECNTPAVKDSGALLTFEGKKYCKDCFDKKAYPIVLEDNDKLNVSITGYDDKEGLFTVTLKNKTKYKISSYQEGESALLDGKTKCIAETDGTHSFAYADIPANEEMTVFSSFRENADEGWETVYKMSEFHTFDFAMAAFIDDESYDDFWETTYKVKLKPEMFGYVK